MSQMEKLRLPIEFQQSCINYQSYPLNLSLVGAKSYHCTLQAHREQLDANEGALFLENESDVCVPIRDLNGEFGDVNKCNIHSSEKLTEWLGVERRNYQENTNQRLNTVALKDPKCRFIYIYAETSRDELRLTRDMLTKILTYHQVNPAYVDFILLFGAQSDPRDLRFSGFCSQVMMKDPPRGLCIPELGRSGRQFQLCYNLKAVELKRNDKQNIKFTEWSIRQAAIHHQFDVVYGTTLWIITKGRLDIQQRYKNLTGPNGRPEDKAFGDVYQCFRSSLATHMMFCHWSVEGWRWYIRWLEDVFEQQSAMAVHGPLGKGHAHRQYKPHHIQELQEWKDKTSESIMVLEANVDVMTTLRKFYSGLNFNNDFPPLLKGQCEDDLDSFAISIDEVMNGLQMQISRARLLASIISDRKELILQHIQSQASERTEQLNLNLEKEAVVMRIVTIVTLLYLPATFVSTFFSTDIIKYQDSNGGEPGPGKFSEVAMIRWLQVTLPLTAITLGAAWWTSRSAENSRQLREANPRAQRYSQKMKSSLKSPWKILQRPTSQIHDDPKDIA